MHRELGPKTPRTDPPPPLTPPRPEKAPSITTCRLPAPSVLLRHMTSAAGPQPGSGMARLSSAPLRNTQDHRAISPPQISPPLTFPAATGTPLPWPGQRPRLLPGPVLKARNQRVTAPPVAFCPASSRGAPARTPRADLLVFALLMTTVRPLVGSLWTVMRERGYPAPSLTQPSAPSGVVEQTSPLSGKTTAIAAARLSPVRGRAESRSPAATGT